MRKDVVLNPDLLYTMVKGLNWLKIEDRLEFYKLIENIPEIMALDKESKTKLIEEVVKLLLPGYISTVISGTKKDLLDYLSEEVGERENPNPNDSDEGYIPLEENADIDYTYSFSVIYEESKGIPKINKIEMYDLMKSIVEEDSPFDNINFYINDNRLFDHGLVWNLTGIAGKIGYSVGHTMKKGKKGKSDRYRYLIYKNDSDRDMIEYYVDDNLIEQMYLKEAILHREDGPAWTRIKRLDEIYSNDIPEPWKEKEYSNKVKQEEWYRDGSPYKSSTTMI